MIEDVFEGIFRVVGRFIWYFLIDILFEILIKGTGCVIYNLFSNNEPNELVATIIGGLFWLLIGV